MGAKTIYDYDVKTASGETLKLSTLKGKTLLIVNVASRCGFTPQYKGLEILFRKLKDKNFLVLGFPCNQFGAQEPGTDQEIQSFCSLNYDVTFPILSKIDVNGDKADPLFQFLKSEEKGIFGSEAIKWNFTKFLISKEGEVLKRFAPTTSPEDIEADIERVL